MEALCNASPGPGIEFAGLTRAHEGSTRPAGGTSFGLSSVSPVTDAASNVTGLARTPNLSTGFNALLTRDSFDRLPIILSAVHNYEQTRIVDCSFATTNDNKKASFRIVTTSPYITTDVSGNPFGESR